MNDLDKIKNSMLWSAYGDALGFITELADVRVLKIRTGGIDHIERLIPWTRRLGGRYGVAYNLPMGCYSDDTQLRLAVCRSVQDDGTFDPDTFSKVELPIFLSYCLGTGLGTRAAAESLVRQSVQWNTNFFKTGRSIYVNGGGNGAAMRIQPLVWACAESTSDKTLLLNVIRNTIITHGHFNAIVGACFHALELRRWMATGAPPDVATLDHTLDCIEGIPDIIRKDDELSLMWLPAWENASGKDANAALSDVMSTMREDVKKAKLALSTRRNEQEKCYTSLLTDLGARERSRAGCACKTSLLASVLGRLYVDAPSAGLVVAANELGSDTDTIATMAGALLGVVHSSEPPEDVLDKAYMLVEAGRLHQIRQKEPVPSHAYPDMATWRPPRAALDATLLDGESLYLKGMGALVPVNDPIEQKSRTPVMWHLCTLPWGQSVIVRHRQTPSALTPEDKPVPLRMPHRAPKHAGRTQGQIRKQSDTEQLGFLGFNQTEPEFKPPEQHTEVDFEKLVSEIVAADFTPAAIGARLLTVASGPEALGRAVELSLALAKVVRKKRKSRSRKGGSARDIDSLTDKVIVGGFEPAEVGQAFLDLVGTKKNEWMLVAYAAIISKARVVRERRKQGLER